MVGHGAVKVTAVSGYGAKYKRESGDRLNTQYGLQGTMYGPFGTRSVRLSGITGGKSRLSGMSGSGSDILPDLSGNGSVTLTGISAGGSVTLSGVSGGGSEIPPDLPENESITLPDLSEEVPAASSQVPGAAPVSSSVTKFEPSRARSRRSTEESLPLEPSVSPISLPVTLSARSMQNPQTLSSRETTIVMMPGQYEAGVIPRPRTIAISGHPVLSVNGQSHLPVEARYIVGTQNNISNSPNPYIHSEHNQIIADGEHVNLIMPKGSIISGSFALYAINDGSINGKNVNGVVQFYGLLVEKGRINLTDANITVTDDTGPDSAGIIFQWQEEQNLVGAIAPVRDVMLTNTKVFAEKTAGIAGPFSSGSINLKNSQIRADVLLRGTGFYPHAAQNENPAPLLTLNADHSILEGGSRPLEGSRTILNLNNGSQWILKISKNEKVMKMAPRNSEEQPIYEVIPIETRAKSEISALMLDNSSILFEGPVEGHYQTLYIGESVLDTKQVYKANGDAKISLNTEWRGPTVKADQKIDQLLIHGEVLGSTKIHVKAVKESEKTRRDNPVLNESGAPLPPNNTRGVSVVQVLGQANEDSFKLENAYTTFDNLPYKYELNAYGPTSKHGAADKKGNKFNQEGSSNQKEEPFWDFRLQNAYADPNAKIRALVPQAASYLTLPNALFSSGLTDLNHQSSVLANMQIMAPEMREGGTKGFFLSSYGDKLTISSKRTPLQYGYDADVRYGAVQTGLTFTASEDQNTTVHLGLLGSYGRIFLLQKRWRHLAKA
ncbi:hypothetical protein [Bartonella australis]|nr:hypothetical protein [Bartonella australis]